MQEVMIKFIAFTITKFCEIFTKFLPLLLTINFTINITLLLTHYCYYLLLLIVSTISLLFTYTTTIIFPVSNRIYLSPTKIKSKKKTNIHVSTLQLLSVIIMRIKTTKQISLTLHHKMLKSNSTMSN